MRLVDSHHHLWDITKQYYPWLTDRVRRVEYGDYSRIRRNYLLSDFRRDIGPLNVEKSVHVQAEHDPLDPVSESRWLQHIADETGSGGFPHAIVAFVDLSLDDAPKILDGHQQYRNVRGVRQMLHFGDASAFLNNPKWRRNLRELAGRGLSFDLQIRHSQMEDAAAIVGLNPDISFVLDHAGCPPLQNQTELDAWTCGIEVLAKRPNLSVKLSGFGMFDPNWTAESVRPVVKTLIEAFGVTRCMFGSNFPVDSLMKDYVSIWAGFSEAVADFSESDRELLFARNVERIYRI